MSIIVVTGANRGIGFGIVQAIASRIPSCTIIIGCRADAAGQDAIKALEAKGTTSALDTAVIDIDDDASIDAAVTSIGEKYGRVDGTHPRSDGGPLGDG